MTVSIVTGASRNIGLATSMALAARGSVVMVARDHDRLELAACRVAEIATGAVVTAALDVADPRAISKFCETIKHQFGQIDVLVNNAFSLGTNHDAYALSRESLEAALETSDTAWLRALEVNALAALRITRALAPLMPDGAAVLNVVGGAAFAPTRGLGPYGMSTAVLWHLTRQLALELAPRVRVNAVCPGTVSPDGTPKNKVQTDLLAEVPLARIGRAEEVANVIDFLTSAAASYVSGQLVAVDGGRMNRSP